jgi:hypothetical protein
MASKGKPPVVEVEWQDAQTVYQERMTSKELSRHSCVLRHSVGFLAEKTREEVKIAGTFDPADNEDDGLDRFEDVTIIPRPWVRKITTLVPTAAPETE